MILGALLLFVAPNVYPSDPGAGIASLAGGAAAGGLGFYLKFVRGRAGAWA